MLAVPTITEAKRLVGRQLVHAPHQQSCKVQNPVDADAKARSAKAFIDYSQPIGGIRQVKFRRHE